MFWAEVVQNKWAFFVLTVSESISESIDKQGVDYENESVDLCLSLPFHAGKFGCAGAARVAGQRQPGAATTKYQPKSRTGSE